VQKVQDQEKPHVFGVPWDELAAFEEAVRQLLLDVESGSLTEDWAQIIFKRER